MRRTAKSKRQFRALEALESRMLLSVTIDATGKTATYTDVDGDAVTIKVTAGTLTGANFVSVSQGLGEYLETIDFSAGGFENAGLTLTVKKAAAGDGLANVGFINSAGHNLGAVSIAGDLGVVNAGTGVGLAVKSLAARSMGRMGLDNQPGGTVTLTSSISGTLGSLSLKGDASSVFIFADNIGAITIGGSYYLSALLSYGNIGAVKITGDLQGGSDSYSGWIQANGNLTSVSVGGSILGGVIGNTGGVYANGNIGAVTIKGNLIGGTETFTGVIWSNAGSVANVSIGGSLVGGKNSYSGSIDAATTLGTVTIKHDLVGGTGDFSGYISSNAASGGLSVGGSIIGGDGVFAGCFSTSADCGSLKIGGDLRGGSGLNSGLYYVSNIKTVAINGSIVGGGGENSGKFIATFNVTSVTVNHDIRGGSDHLSGSLNVGNALATLKIGGSLIGGTADNTGYIEVNTLGTATIGGDIIGSSVSFFQSLNYGGAINATAIKSLTVGGSIFAGANNSSGSLNLSGAVVAAQGLGTLAVKGSLVGSVGTGGVTHVLIVAKGVQTQTTTDLVMKSVTIGFRMERAKILAGYTPDFVPQPDNGDAQIGTIKIGGDMIASSIIAGADNDPSTNVKFGDGGDASIGAGTAAITASIDSITIGGLVLGTPDLTSSTDHFGIVAQLIKSVKIGTTMIPLTALAGNDNVALGLFGDFNIHEV